MPLMRSLLLALLLGSSCSLVAAAGEPKRDWQPVELIGHAADFWHSRNWRSYYWREDFTFLLNEDGGKQRRVISREPTPAFDSGTDDMISPVAGATVIPMPAPSTANATPTRR